MAKHTAKVIAVFGRTRRAGRWTICDHSVVVSFFGHCHLDLTKAITEEDTEDVSMTVVAVFGSVTVVVPPGSNVTPSGMAFLSSAGIDLPTTDTTSELVPVELEWTAVFSRVRVIERAAGEPGPEKAAAVERQAEAEPVNRFEDVGDGFEPEQAEAMGDAVERDRRRPATEGALLHPQQSGSAPSWARFEISPEELAAATGGAVHARRDGESAQVETGTPASPDSSSSESEADSDLDHPSTEEPEPEVATAIESSSKSSAETASA